VGPNKWIDLHTASLAFEWILTLTGLVLKGWQHKHKPNTIGKVVGMTSHRTADTTLHLHGKLGIRLYWILVYYTKFFCDKDYEWWPSKIKLPIYLCLWGLLKNGPPPKKLKKAEKPHLQRFTIARGFQCLFFFFFLVVLCLLADALPFEPH
jgi:hypothetical protein